MPRYFLHMSLSSAYIHDHEGVELADHNAARERAIQDIMAVWKVRIVKRHFRSVSASQPRHVREQPLPFSIGGSVVIQPHGELADRPREALGHLLNSADPLVLEASCDDSRFIDARSAVLSREWMRPRFELPIQDVIETVHGGHPCGAPQQRMLIPGHLSCQQKRRTGSRGQLRVSCRSTGSGRWGGKPTGGGACHSTSTTSCATAALSATRQPPGS